jgi:hypothetical protein
MEKKRKCTYRGRAYEHGEKRCYLSKCFVCDDGRWLQTTGVKSK